MFFDLYGRTIRYLRLSITDECNLRCFYCYPVLPKQPTSHLTDQEILRLCRLMALEGVKTVHFTGGEPLLRSGLSKLIKAIASIPGITDLALTTNGTLLTENLSNLIASGLRRVNISLDTLRPDRYVRITGKDALHEVLSGIAEAESLGIYPLKLNVVVMRGVNEDELVDFALLSVFHPLEVRFIELMPIGFTRSIWKKFFVAMDEVRQHIERLGQLIPENTNIGRYSRFRFHNAPGFITFISPVTQPFCCSCDRIRLTATGDLHICLRSNNSVSLKPLLDAGCSDEEIIGTMRRALQSKPQSDRFVFVNSRSMVTIGG